MSFILLVEQAAPETPSANQVVLYPKTDGIMYSKDDAGTERAIALGVATQAEADAGVVVKAITADLNRIVLGTLVATTSGSSHVFGSIPAGVRRITVSLHGVSTNGTNPLLLRIGDSGGVEDSGYISMASRLPAAASVDTDSDSTAFRLTNAPAATEAYSGSVVLTLMDEATFLWAATGVLGTAANIGSALAGSKALSAELTQIELLTVDTFDAGSVNIAYER